MGWYHTEGSTLKSTIKELTEECKGKRLLKSCFRGAPTHKGILWTVWELDCKDGVTRRLIGCDLLEYWNNRNGGWAYKPLDETMGPCAVNCPLSYLKIASGPNSFEDHKCAKDWRNDVIAYHAKRKANKVKISTV